MFDVAGGEKLIVTDDKNKLRQHWRKLMRRHATGVLHEAQSPQDAFGQMSEGDRYDLVVSSDDSRPNTLRDALRASLAML